MEGLARRGFEIDGVTIEHVVYAERRFSVLGDGERAVRKAVEIVDLIEPGVAEVSIRVSPEWWGAMRREMVVKLIQSGAGATVNIGASVVELCGAKVIKDPTKQGNRLDVAARWQLP